MITARSSAGSRPRSVVRRSGTWPLRHRIDRSPRTERGLVSAEFAVAILAALSLLLSLLSGVSLVVTQVRCFDVAAQVARQLARGDTAAAEQARRAAPAGSQISVRRGDHLISVTVTVQARPWGSALPGVRLSADAEIVPEPGADRG